MLSTSLFKIAEGSQTNFFSFEFFPEDKEDVKTHGRLFMLLRIKDDSANMIVPLETARKVFSFAKESYLGATGNPFDNLNETVKRVVEKYGSDLQMAACSFVDGVLYVSVFRDMSISLLREGSLVQLLQGKEGMVSASGYPKKDDLIFIGSSDFLEAFKNKIPSLFKREGTEEAVKLFSSLVSQGQYCAVVSFEGDESHIQKVQLEQEAAGKSGYLSGVMGRMKTIVSGQSKRKVVEDGNQRKKSGDGDKKKTANSEKPIKVRKVFESVDEMKTRRKTMLVGIMLLILLVVSIGFGIKRQRDKEYLESYEGTLLEAIHNFEEAEKLVGLNPSRSRELFIQSKDQVSDLLAQGYEDERLARIRNEIAEKGPKILGEFGDEPSLFVDLTLIEDNVQAVDMASFEEDFVVMDVGGERVIRVGFSDKNTRVIVGPSQFDDDPKRIAYSPPSAFILDDEKVYGVGSDRFEVADIENADLIYSFAGNIYLLRKSDSEIFRLSVITGGFASPAVWLASDQTVDFENVVSWTIDGSVWILEDDGEIRKFGQGFEENFSYSSPFSLLNPTQIHTDNELDHLYVLDTEVGMVLVLDKEGQFVAQYKNDQLKAALDLVASQEERVLVFLTSDKLYSLELKHLE